MAMLEVHDGRGRVAYVTVARDHPVLIGSDPKCDVVLDDPRAQAFHARLRWKGDHFKAEAFPEARAVDLNGRRVPAGQFRQGDEIQIGGYRIFLVGDEPAAAAAASKAEAEPTRVQRRPSTGGGGIDWMAAEVEAPSIETPVRARRARVVERPSAATQAVLEEAAAEAPVVLPRTRQPWWRQVLAHFRGGPPGEERILTSPLFLGLLVALGLLLMFGFALWTIIAKNRADRQYFAALQAHDERNYRAAIDGFDQFIAENGGDLRAGRAMVLRELDNVRQFTSPGGANWPTAVEGAREMLRKVGERAEFAEFGRMDLAAEVLKAVGGLADAAKARAEAKILAEAQEALALHEQIAGPAAAKLTRERARIPEKIAEAQAAVDKARIRREAIARMKEAADAGKADDVFATRDALVAQYADFADDAQVLEQLDAAGELLRQAVKFDGTRRPADTTPRPDALGPPVSVVFRLVPPGEQPVPATPDGPVVFALAQGYLYGVDGAVGAPLWQVPVGMTSPFPPVPVAGTPPTVLIFDARYNDLVRLDGRTGKVLWRQAIDEPVRCAPLVLGNIAAQVLPSGKVLLIALNNGEVRGTVDLGRPAAGTPAADDAGQFFYVTADRDVIFVLTREPVECISVAYLGQKPGAVKTAPARLGDFLIVPQDDELWEGRLTVYRAEEHTLQRAQVVKVPGWTWQAPASAGAYLWAMTDRNAITAYAQGPEDAKDPLTVLASTVADNRPSGPAYFRPRSDRELWVSGSRLGRFDLDAERGSLVPSWTIERAGPSLGPIQVAGRLAVFTHQFEEGPGVTLWGVDPVSNGRVIWKTVLGAPWPLEPSPTPDGKALATLAMDGPEVTIDGDLLSKGGFLEMPLRRPGYFNLPPGPLRRLDRDGLTVLIPAPESDHLLVREGGTGEFRRVDLPAPLGAPPVFWGPDLFVPGLDGRAYLVDPRTGSARAEPYVPTFDAERPTRWRAPIFLGDAVVLADSAGQVRRLARLTEPRLRLDVVGDPVDLKSPIEADPAATTDAVILVTADGRVRALGSRELGPLGAWNLPAALAVGPATLGGRQAFVVDKSGGVMFFGPDGQRVWATDLGDAPPVGPPIERHEALWFLTREGVIHALGLSDGASVERIDLNILPAGGLWAVGDDVVVAAAPGTVRLLKPADASTAGGAP
jgi:outer membrane protein assembly factor BamB